MDTSSNLHLLEAEGQLNKEIQAALTNFRQKLLAKVSPSKQIISITNYDSDKHGPQKVFVFRESLLSLMFQINDFRTIYNMVVASFIILTFSLIYNSYHVKGQILDVISLYKFFKGNQIVLTAWISLTAVFYAIIPVTKVALKTSIWLWLPLYLIQITCNMTIAVYFASSEKLGFASAIIIMAQSTRMLMKAHSYLRTKLIYCTDNPYKNFEFRGMSVVNSSKNGNQTDKQLRIDIQNQDIFKEIRKLSYFFFCPTLIYRDHYTLTPARSFHKIVIHFVNFLACTYYSFILYQNMCKPVIENLQNNLNFSTLLATVINLMLPSVLFLIMGFFGFLHSWLNLWSQITRFPDRAFYSDWWNSCEFGSYYRKWNIVVHDWLYYYIYLDLYRFFPTLKRVKALAQLATFIISAIIHELIIYYAIGFFYPILFILFAGPGIIFVQSKSLRSSSVNLIFWLQMYIGTAMLFTFYLVQCFARLRIDSQAIQKEWGSLQFLIPRTAYLGGS